MKGSVCRCGEGGGEERERRGREGGNGKSERKKGYELAFVNNYMFINS